jgi:hypothetical protein
MFRGWRICKMVVLSCVGGLVLLGAPDAWAQKQKKLTYEQAYRKCKAQIDVNFPPGSSQTAGRNSAGAACMHDLGFLPKKSVMF